MYQSLLIIELELPRHFELLFLSQVKEAVFHCPSLFTLQSWHHIAVVINKDSVLMDKVLRGKPKVTLFVNGQLQGTRKVNCLLGRA